MNLPLGKGQFPCNASAEADCIGTVESLAGIIKVEFILE
jgi:hypothetical protein